MRLQKFLPLAACCMALAAHAQWQWLDQDGRKVFSDRSPPSSVPEKNILKQPGQRSRSDGAYAAPTPAATSANAQSASPAKVGDGVDPGLLEKRKQTADAEAAKRRAEEERLARSQTESCARARQAKGGLDTGVRIARTNDKGEREFMDEAARAEEGRRIQAVIDSDCK